MEKKFLGKKTKKTYYYEGIKYEYNEYGGITNDVPNLTSYKTSEPNIIQKALNVAGVGVYGASTGIKAAVSGELYDTRNHSKVDAKNHEILRSNIKSGYIAYIEINPLLDKDEVHALLFFTLKNNKSVIVEYGAYDEKYPNEFNSNPMYYINKYKYGLRYYEATFNEVSFKAVSYDEIKIVKPVGLTLLDAVIKANKEGNYIARKYNAFTHNCQHFVANMIRILKIEIVDGRPATRETNKYRIPKIILDELRKTELNNMKGERSDLFIEKIFRENGELPPIVPVERKVKIKTWNNRFLISDGHRLRATGDDVEDPLEPGEFILIPIEGKEGEYYIKTPFYKYLSVNMIDEIIETDYRSNNSIFELTYGKDGDVTKRAFRTCYGKFICCEKNGKIIANRKEAKMFESYTLFDC